MKYSVCAVFAMIVFLPCVGLAQEPIGPNSASEPFASGFSLAATARFLDTVSSQWTEQKKCGTCHTNYPFLMARPTLRDYPGATETQVRSFLLDRAANWETKKPRWDTEVVATASVLAYHDAQTTGKLHPVTRQALDRMWTLQRPDGSWNWLKCNWPPAEADDYYGVLFAALGLGDAPDGYTTTPKANEGIERMASYLKNQKAPSLHHALFRIWATRKLPDLAAKDSQVTLDQAVKLQRPDGGWSLASLGDWKRHNGTMNDPLTSPSDGYATALVVHVLRESGHSRSHPSVMRGIAWLESNQRQSGRWFTRSPSNDKYHYLTHMGTAFAVLALKN